MMRQSSSRNHRSRGWKVKHVLQVCLLVAVCVWLLYQVKHSHDKKKALEEGALRVSDRVEESRPDFLKLGRKDPQENTVVTSAGNTAHGEEEENEEVEEATEQENRQEENEEEGGRGAGDEEIDESDQEKGDDEAEGGEEFGDEEDKERQSEDAGMLENGDHEDDEGKSQGAREEHYKADDASSAVVRDTQEVVQENGDLSAGSLDEEQKEKTEKDELKNDSRTNGTEVASKDDEMHDLPTTDENQLNNSISLNDTTAREKELEAESIQNSTVVLGSTGHIEEHSLTTSNFSDHLEKHDNSTTFEPNDQNEQQSNSVGTVSDELKEAQNVATANNAEAGESTPENGTINLDSTQDQSRLNETRTQTEGNSISENTLVEQTGKSNVTERVEGFDENHNGTERVDGSDENHDAIEGVEESDENHNASSITNGDSDSIQGEATDSSNDVSNIMEEDREARTDLSTLPDIQIETRKEEDIAAE